MCKNVIVQFSVKCNKVNDEVYIKYTNKIERK